MKRSYYRKKAQRKRANARAWRDRPNAHWSDGLGIPSDMVASIEAYATYFRHMCTDDIRIGDLFDEQPSESGLGS